MKGNIKPNGNDIAFSFWTVGDAAYYIWGYAAFRIDEARKEYENAISLGRD